jgi:hypothetical protein
MNKQRVSIFLVFIIAMVVFMVSCQENKQIKKMSWQETMMNELPVLGHRNWVVVADSAFPAYTQPGIKVIATGEDHFVVLEKVLKAVDQSKHIRPHIYLDKELDFVPEQYASGMDACRKRLAEALEGRNAKPILHEELISKLDEVAKTFRILMLKTTLTLPYTSVFMELDCGYWSGEGEAALRERMKK